MAETLLSPGVLARENDQSQVSQGPISVGAAIIGPTTKGPVEIPTAVTSYSQYKSIFGGAVESGSDSYNYMTGISVYNYFQNGGESLLVTRVTSGSFTPAISTAVENNVSQGTLVTSADALLTSIGAGYDVALTASTQLLPDADALLSSIQGTYSVPVSASSPLLEAADSLLSSIATGFNISSSAGNGPGTVGLIGLTGSIVGAGGVATISYATSESISGITVTAPGAGYTIGEIITIPSASAGADIAGGSDIVITLNAADLASIPNGPGRVTGVGVTGSLAGVDALADITFNTSQSITSFTLTAGGTGFVAGESIIIPSSSLGANQAGGSDVSLIIQPADLKRDNGPGALTGIGLTGSLSGAGAVADITFATSESISTITLTNAGTGFVVGETITIPSASLGATQFGGDDVVITVKKDDIVHNSAFTLETLSEGIIMNNAGSETKGALVSGSADSVRFEIASVNTSSGQFSLLVRRGDDNNQDKAVLETWTNLSLDPKADNYIEKVIGNTTKEILEDNGTYYIQDQGSFINKSKFIRVKEVNFKTPDYFDNNGLAKAQFTASLPQVGSGSFEGATGDLFNPAIAAKFYDKVDTTDIQGLVASDYNTAVQLMGNKDEYRFTSVTAPGLTTQNAASVVTSLVNNSVSRGDSIAIVDLVNFGANVGTVTTQAATFDSSYAAAYWPWVQTIDPETGQQVWSPPSAVIPGVYAYTDRSSDAWFAPAGLTRGALGNVIRAERKLPSTTRDTLYEANVNPIATFPQSGVVVFGQKTLQKRASALDRVNVRRLLIAVKGYVSQIADTLVFEQNTLSTRNNFLTQVNPYLESVQQRQGLYAFKVVMDETNNGPDVVDRNQLVGQIFLQPTKTAEFVLLDFNVTPTGATFE